MRLDLLEAQECVNWTVAQLPAFQQRLTDWIDSNIDIIVKNADPPSPNKLVIAKERAVLPPSFSVEAGAYINVIRSGLDILASSLSARNGKTGNIEAHFPMFRSDLHMLDPKCGLESIKWLTKDQRAIIKSLEPYPGGNDALRTLHQLDIMRKHRRLLNVTISPAWLSITGIKREHFVLPKGHVGANGETLLVILFPDAAEGQFNGTFFIALNEAGYYGTLPVYFALRQLASIVQSAIAMFDVP